MLRVALPLMVKYVYIARFCAPPLRVKVNVPGLSPTSDALASGAVIETITPLSAMVTVALLCTPKS